MLLAKLLNTQVKDLTQIPVSDALELMSMQKVITNTSKQTATTVQQIDSFLKGSIKNLELNEMNKKLNQLKYANKEKSLVVLDLLGAIRSGTVWQKMTIDQASLYFNVQLNNGIIIVCITLIAMLCNVPVCCSRWLGKSCCYCGRGQGSAE